MKLLVVMMASSNPVPNRVALEEIYYDDSDRNGLKVYADIDDYSTSRCRCEVQTDHIRAICPDYVRLIHVQPDGFGPPELYPHSLQELCVMGVANQALRCTQPSEYERLMARISGLPDFVKYWLLTIQYWGCRFWDSASRFVVWLTPTWDFLYIGEHQQSMFHDRASGLRSGSHRQNSGCTVHSPCWRLQDHPDDLHVTGLSTHIGLHFSLMQVCNALSSLVLRHLTYGLLCLCYILKTHYFSFPPA